MTAFFDRYFSFHGRMARRPFFVRGIYLGFIALVPFLVSILLFSNGVDVLWYAGLVAISVAIAVIGVGTASLLVRRLHDLGLSGYHAIWVGAAELIWTILSRGSLQVMLLGLPCLGISLWLLFWPGNTGANRFGNS